MCNPASNYECPGLLEEHGPFLCFQIQTYTKYEFTVSSQIENYAVKICTYMLKVLLISISPLDMFCVTGTKPFLFAYCYIKCVHRSTFNF